MIRKLAVTVGVAIHLMSVSAMAASGDVAAPSKNVAQTSAPTSVAQLTPEQKGTLDANVNKFCVSKGQQTGTVTFSPSGATITCSGGSGVNANRHIVWNCNGHFVGTLLAGLLSIAGASCTPVGSTN